MAYGKWIKQTPLFGVPVPSSGPRPALFMLIGERPGKTEPASGKIFSGAVGHELSRYLRLSSLTREEVFLTNLVRDYRDDDITEEEVLRDLPLLLEELIEVSPSYIVPMGRAAIRYFLGDVDVEQVHGIAFPGAQFGYPDSLIYPVYHPAAGLHSADNIPIIYSDFRGLADVESRIHPIDPYMQGPEGEGDGDHDGIHLHYGRWNPGPPPPSPLPPSLLLAADSEGWVHDPYSIQYTQRVGRGTMVYRSQSSSFLPLWTQFLDDGGSIVIHNSLHDLSVFRSLGLPIRPTQFIDSMLLAYLLCTYPQGLKPLAFRIAGMSMQSYDEVTSPARDSIQREWLAAARAVSDSISPPELELVWDDKKGNWRVKKPHTIDQRIKRLASDVEAGKTKKDGTPLIIAERVANWGDSAADELRDICGEVPEPTLGDIPAAIAERYACRDADATLRIAPHLIREVREQGMELVSQIDHSILPMIDRMQTNGILIDPDHFRRLDEEWTTEMGAVRDQIEEMVGVRINPSSPDQVSALLFKQLGLPSRKLTKGGDDSTQDKVLEGLRSAHPVLPLIMDYRELDKMRGSFCRKMLKLMGPDHRVRGNIRVTRTASGRLAMNSPNLMAIPVRMARGRRIREGFIARPGCVIGNWDLDQIEMREIADASGDEFLYELFSNPDRDIHSETAGRMFDKPPSAVDPKTERYAAKRVGFGIATQITGAGLVDQMELAGATHADGSHWTADECDHLIELWFGVYPGVRRFIDRTKAQVRRTGIVRDRWGRVRHLEGVWSTIDRIRAEAERQGPSHVIQAGAQGVMKQNMAVIDRNLSDMPDVWPLLQIHDSLMLEYPEELHDLVNEIVMDGMENTVRYTVPITASGEYGYSWGKMNLGEE